MQMTLMSRVVPPGTQIEMFLPKGCNCTQAWNLDWSMNGTLLNVTTKYLNYGFGFVCQKSVDVNGWEGCRPNRYRVNGRGCDLNEVSPKSCEELGWHRGQNFGFYDICAGQSARYGSCPADGTFKEVTESCRQLGARVCTADEIRQDEPRGGVCRLDEQRVWTATPCSSGAHITSAGSASSLGDIVQQCTPDTRKLPVRCCADGENVVRIRQVLLPDQVLPSVGFSLKINCGGPSKDGFVSDAFYYNGGEFIDLAVPPGQGELDTVLSSARMATNGAHLIYDIPLSKGLYNLTLFFAEISTNFSAIGARIFDIGVTELNRGWPGSFGGFAQFDIVARAGEAGVPYQATFYNLNVEQGIKIGLFNKGSGPPSINAIIVSSDREDIAIVMRDFKPFDSVQATVDLSAEHQTIEGIGAAFAWYGDWVLQHPSRNSILDKIFGETQLSVLRLRNDFDRDANIFTVGSAGVRIYEEAKKRISGPFKILMTSWTPPSYLKESSQLRGNGQGNTLKKIDGAYLYEEFGYYWRQSLERFQQFGIYPDWISIQNEPDFEPAWEGCRFLPTEDESFAGFDLALEAVHKHLSSMSSPPKILGPEVTGLGLFSVQSYLDKLNLSMLSGVAHHLYGTQFDGGDFNLPVSFVPAMEQFAKDNKAKYGNLPIFQTEFARLYGRDDEDPIHQASIIHYALTKEQVQVYLHWDGFWGAEEATLIKLEQPYDPSLWTNPDGYEVFRTFYAFKHYAKLIRPGWTRVDVTVDDGSVLVSAFKGPTPSDLSVIIVNTGFNSKRLLLDGVESGGFGTVQLTTRTDAEWDVISTRFQSGSVLDLPERSIVSVSF